MTYPMAWPLPLAQAVKAVVVFPAGIVFTFVFHRLFKYHVILHLPRPFDRIFSGLAFERFRISGSRQWTVLVTSIIIGALSHFAWDSFTNPTGEMTRLIPYLLRESNIFGIPIENYVILHHLSSIFGGIIVLSFMLRSRYIPRPVIEKPLITSIQKFRFWATGIGLATIFAIGAVAYFNYIVGWSDYQTILPFRIGKAFGLAGWAGFFYFACIFTLIHKPSREKYGSLASDGGRSSAN